MAAYSIFLKKSATRELEALPERDLARIIERIAALADDPRPPGAEKLTGQDRYRLRQGNHRVIYSVQDKERTVWVVKIGHRREVYR